MSEVPLSLGSSLQWRTAHPVLESPPPNSHGDTTCSPMDATLEMSPVTTGCAPKWKPTKSLFVKSFLRRIGSSSGNKDSLPNLKTMGTKNKNGDSDSYDNNVVTRNEGKTSVQMLEKSNVEENPIMESKDDLDSSLVTALGAFTICSPAPNVITLNSRPASAPNCTENHSQSSINVLSPTSLSSLTLQDASSSPALLLPKQNGDHLEGLQMSDEKVCLIQEPCKEQCKGDTSHSRNTEDSQSSFAVQFNEQEEDVVSPLHTSGDIDGLVDISRDDSLLDGSEETSSVWLAARRSSQSQERTGLVRKLELLSHSTQTVEHDDNSVPVLDSDVSPNSYFQPSTINDCPKTTDISLPITENSIKDYGSTSIASSVSISGSTITSTTTTTNPTSSTSMTTMSTKKIFPMSKAMSASSLPCVTPHMKPAVSALSVYSSLPRKPASSLIHNRTVEPSSVSCASPSSSTSRPAHRGVPFHAKFTTPPSVLQGTSKLKPRSTFSPTVSLSSSLGRKTGAMAREVVSPSTSYISQDSGSPLRRTLQHSKHANISRHSLDSIRSASSDSPFVSHLATKQQPAVTPSMTSSMMKTSSASRLPTKVPTITSSSSLSRLPRRVLSRVDRM